MPSDIEIAHSVSPQPITAIAARMGIPADELLTFGRYKAKLPLHLIDPGRIAASRLILVSAISPTPPGEGKTTMSIGLAQALNHIGKRATVVLREPSLGPVFGIKGGATGGGWSQVLPMEDINLHFNGDFAAVEKAHNLLAALIDNHVQVRDSSPAIDPRTVTWKRVMDMNDRSLRQIVVGLGGTGNGVPRESGFDITAASEVMAILCLAESIADLKQRLGRILVGFTPARQPVYARDLGAAGAMAALLKDALLPNLVQTLEGTPAIIHGGPFANIAQGTNTVLATKMGLSLSEMVVTEAGFGSDLGAEKFLDIKCQSAGLSPHTIVLVATLRALKYHGGADPASVALPNEKALRDGLCNLDKHIENARRFGVPVVVAINRFATDLAAETGILQDHCAGLGVPAIEADVWGQGGRGGEELARTVVRLASEFNGRFQPLYDWNWPVRRKIETICREVYGAAAVAYTPRATADLRTIRKLGLEGVPVCIAKTQKSLSDDPDRIGRPRNFTITVRQIEIAAGAGFVIPITGEIVRMPGLPNVPTAVRIDLDDDGTIRGLE